MVATCILSFVKSYPRSLPSYWFYLYWTGKGRSNGSLTSQPENVPSHCQTIYVYLGSPMGPTETTKMQTGVIWARLSLVCRRWIFSEIFTFSFDAWNVPATLKGWSFHGQINTFQVCLSWQSTGSVVEAHGIRCSVACGILPDQGLNPCLLHWRVDSLPLSHPGRL